MFAATPCRCGADRQTARSFCESCFSKLPAELANGVRLHHGADGARAVHAANVWLDAWEADQATKRARLMTAR